MWFRSARSRRDAARDAGLRGQSLDSTVRSRLGLLASVPSRVCVVLQPRAAACCLALLISQAAERTAFDRGMAAFQARDWAAAESAFREAVAAKPRFARAWKLLGMVYAAQERYERALEPFERACDLDPNEESACYYLGRTSYTLNRYEDARRAFERALESGRDLARIMHGFALTYEALGETQQAERSFREAIRTGDRQALTDYASFLHREGRGREALELLRKVGATAKAERVSRALAGAPARGIASAVPVKFHESTLDMLVRNGATGRMHQIETMLAGVAVFDYDNDGWPDIFVANGAEIPSLRKTDASFHDRLFRNKRDGTFSDVTSAAGLSGAGYSMGVAAGDYDNDGWTDLFVAGVRHNTLYRNRGGWFENVSARAGLRENGGWTIAAAWFDHDNDGWLDLFVARYVVWNPATEPSCGGPEPGRRMYCHPRFYAPLPNALYRNQGDGTFRDVSDECGLTAHPGKGMGVAPGDYDGDGRIDVFVANDTVPNFLFRNQGTFAEMAMTAGVALDENGLALSSMGVEFKDYDNDGREDVFVTTLTNERWLLFRNLGRGVFIDVSAPSRIGSQSLPWSGWSAGAFDFNNDGFKDFLVASGNVIENAELTSSRTSRQPNSVLVNKGDGTFEMQLLPGLAFHRGAAFGDLDRDGRVDAVVTRLNERPLVLRNVTPNAGHWLALALTGTASNRDAIGARVHIVTDTGEQWSRVTTSNGYASSSNRVLHFGLGADTRARLVEIEWPSGSRQRLEDVAADRVVSVTEPSGGEAGSSAPGVCTCCRS
jgi:tetratricopeptide (TPR) repeat protein